MANIFELPALGETVEAGTLVRIAVAEGEPIEEGQTVLELETDKAVLEVPSSVSGIVGKLLVREGETVKVGQPIFELAGAADSAPVTQESVVKDESQLEERVPTAQYDTPATETATSRDTPATPPVSSATATQTAPTTPTHETNGSGGTESGAPSNNGYAVPQQVPQNGAGAPQVAPGNAPQIARDPAAAAPSVRRMAREMGVDIHEVHGSGLGGRISEEDVKSHVKGVVTSAQGSNGSAPQAATPSVTSPSATQSAPLPDFSKFGAVERQPMSNVRRATSTQMMRAWEIPHVTQFDKADITDLEALRKEFAPRAEKLGAKLTVTAIVLKALASALREFPTFNSSLDLASNEIVLKSYVNVGVAVDTERGLLVPVLRDVDKKGAIQLARELGEIAGKARDKKLGLDDMQGGCFTLTNLGGIGGTYFTPIINAPEVAILGLSRSLMEPTWRDGACVGRLMMPMSLSYDHRAIDGADGARFLRRIAESLENPFLLALG